MPEEAIFVDDRSENIESAEALGIHAILYENPDQLVADLGKFIPRLVSAS